MRNRTTETTYFFKEIGIQQLQILPDLLEDMDGSGGFAPNDCIEKCPGTI